MTSRRSSNDLTLTPQRDAVLRVVRESLRHLTAGEIFDKARASFPRISFATVYNSLRYLRDHGLIGEVRFGSDAVRFDRRLSKHDHALCSVCNDLIDLDLPIPESLIKEAARLSKFVPESLEFTLHGQCPKCHKARSAIKNTMQNRIKDR